MCIAHARPLDSLSHLRTGHCQDHKDRLGSRSIFLFSFSISLQQTKLLCRTFYPPGKYPFLFFRERFFLLSIRPLFIHTYKPLPRVDRVSVLVDFSHSILTNRKQFSSNIIYFRCNPLIIIHSTPCASASSSWRRPLLSPPV